MAPAGGGDNTSSLVLRTSRRRNANTSGGGRDWDRFIPNRSAMNMDYARYMLTEGNRWCRKKPDEEQSSDYCKLLAKVLGQDRRSILSFGPKPPDPLAHLNPAQQLEAIVSDFYKFKKKPRVIPQNPEAVLGLPDFLGDDSLNLLDWGSRDTIAVALLDQVHLKTQKSVRRLVTIPEEHAPITSVSWAPDGRSLALGLNSSYVQLWDVESNRMLRTFAGGHLPHFGVGSLGWKDHQNLTSGGMDARVINRDTRAPSHVFHAFQGHTREVCGLKWCASGTQLATGGNDNLLHIWDGRFSVSAARTPWLHRLEGHTAPVKALAWSPFQANLLASGGGVADQRIKFWNTSNGACLNTVDTGSQVSALLWNPNERELLSSHGLPGNQLILWKYPAMAKLAELARHRSPVLSMAQSPSGCTVAAADQMETLMLWNVFGNPAPPHHVPRSASEPFAHFNRIR